MPLEVTIDDRVVQQALRQLPGRAALGLKKGMQIFAADTVREFTKKRLSAADDRVAVPELNGLGVRPSASKGLVRRSGSMARGLLTTTMGNAINDLITKIGFLSPFSARIARVHEFGTIGKGGTLPDIRPKRGQYLKIPIRGLSAALGKAGGFVLLRKVSIPARLGFRAFVAAALKSGKLEKAIVQGVKRVLTQGKAA